MATITRTKAVNLLVGGVLAFVGAVVLIAVLSSPGSSTKTTISGTFTLGPDYALIDGGTCVGMGSYQDIHNGTPVWVFDKEGHPLASSTLTFSRSWVTGGRSAHCQFTFSISGVESPRSVQVGDHADEKAPIVGGSVSLESHLK